MKSRNLISLCLLYIAYVEATPEQRVVNGTDANIEDFPFMVSVRNQWDFHDCGGSLISPEWVLTAAHCIDGTTSGFHSIQHSDSMISINGSTIVPVKYAIVHEHYDLFLLINDISVLRLQHPVHVKEYVKLPEQFEGTLGDIPATLIGWGYTGVSSVDRLQRVEIQTFSHEECSRRHNGGVYTSNICGGVPDGWKGQCSGDSGGPLLVNRVQVGVVSWSEKPCTIPPYPGVYTRVSYFREWIRQKTGV